MSDKEVLQNRKQRKAFEKSYEKAQKQFKRMQDDAKETTKRVMGPVQEQMEKDIANGKTDFSLYNLILSIADYSKCATAQDSCRLTYEYTYPYMRRMNLRIKSLVAMAEKYKDNMSQEDLAYLKEITESNDLDPFRMATEILQKEQERARQRSKLGLKFYDGQVKL